MKLVLVLLCFLVMPVATAEADWRWAGPPKYKLVVYSKKCDGKYQCIRHSRYRAKLARNRRVDKYHTRKLKEWNYWTNLYIPDCTWYGESGRGPKYARFRYTVLNSQGSGARGKFQFMPGTYFNNAKYGDWSPLDQELSARREFWKHGTSPWQACG